MIRPFAQRYRAALADTRLPKNLLAFQRAWRTTRDAAFDRLASETRSSSWQTAREQLIEAKNRVLADPLTARRGFVENARSTGAVVHEVESAEQARNTILTILRDGGVHLLAKGKSMVAEEIFLNHHLEAAGLTVEVEVCCGFGGGSSIDHPEVSRGIVARKLENVRTTGAAVVCSDNPGCILHLRGAADAAGLRLEVKHVAELLAEALVQPRSPG